MVGRGLHGGHDGEDPVHQHIGRKEQISDNMVAPGMNSAISPNRMAKTPRSATAHQFCARTALIA